VGRRVPGSYYDLGGIEFKLALGLKLGRLTHRRLPVSLELSGGLIGIAKRGWQYDDAGGQTSGEATAVRSGGDLALYLGWTAGAGTLYAGPLAAVEVVWLDATSGGHLQHEIHTGIAAGARAGYQYRWLDRFFLRLDVTGAIALLRQRIATVSHREKPIFEAPPGYATLSVGAGVWF
jgi:hypothetical protein